MSIIVNLDKIMLDRKDVYKRQVYRRVSQQKGKVATDDGEAAF